MFLDEVAELPLTLQPKLLRVLEERVFYRLGDVKRREFSARIICAANRDLSDMVDKGLFRRDLYHRLRVGHLQIAPLRERGEDIVTLAYFVLRREAERKKKRFSGIGDEALRMLCAYPWPGNVREMENTIERAVLMNDGELLLQEHLYFLSPTAVEPPRESALSPDEGWISFGSNGWVRLPKEPFQVKDLTEAIIRQTLERFAGNKSKAAAYLGISRFALQRRLGGA